jgi:hypothetical protein
MLDVDRENIELSLSADWLYLLTLPSFRSSLPFPNSPPKDIKDINKYLDYSELHRHIRTLCYHHRHLLTVLSQSPQHYNAVLRNHHRRGRRHASWRHHGQQPLAFAEWPFAERP